MNSPPGALVLISGFKKSNRLRLPCASSVEHAPHLISVRIHVQNDRLTRVRPPVGRRRSRSRPRSPSALASRLVNLKRDCALQDCRHHTTGEQRKRRRVLKLLAPAAALVHICLFSFSYTLTSLPSDTTHVVAVVGVAPAHFAGLLEYDAALTVDGLVVGADAAILLLEAGLADVFERS